MVVGLCRVVLIIHGSQSLKEKRRVLKSLLKKVRDRFNVSAAEVGAHELWQRAEIGIATVAGDGSFVNSVIDKVLDYIDNLQVAEISDQSIEIINL